MILLIGYLVKMIFFPASLADSIIVAAITALSALSEFKLKDAKIAEFEEKLTIFEKNCKNLEEELKKTQSSVAAVRVSNGFRPMNSKAAPL